jgi:hypothetical protein
MADTPIPADLLAAQRAFDAATATLMAETEAVSVERRRELRQAELDAMRVLRAARSGTPWDTVTGQKALRAAAEA